MVLSLTLVSKSAPFRPHAGLFVCLKLDAAAVLPSLSLVTSLMCLRFSAHGSPKDNLGDPKTQD